MSALGRAVSTLFVVAATSLVVVTPIAMASTPPPPTGPDTPPTQTDGQPATVDFTPTTTTPTTTAPTTTAPTTAVTTVPTTSNPTTTSTGNPPPPPVTLPTVTLPTSTDTGNPPPPPESSNGPDGGTGGDGAASAVTTTPTAQITTTGRPTTTAPASVAPTVTGPPTRRYELLETVTLTPTVTGNPTPTLGKLGTLPLGLDFDSITGQISGQVSADATPGLYEIAVRATNTAGESQPWTVVIEIEQGYPLDWQLSASNETPLQGETITMHVSAHNASGYQIEDISEQLTWSSSVPTDTVNGNQITFNHASPHTITAEGFDITRSITLQVTPVAGLPAGTPSTDDEDVAGVDEALPNTGLPAESGGPNRVQLALLMVLAGVGLLAASARPRRS